MGGPGTDLGPPAPPEGPEGLIGRIEELMPRLQSVDDPVARATAEELVTSLMELYGEGLGRIFSALSLAGSRGREITDALLEDGVVASLLLIHGLYPVDLEQRVIEALDSVRPYLESHGGDVELVDVEGDVAHLRLKGSCDGCPASASTLELAIKQALEETAPDLLGIEVEGMNEPEAPAVGIGKPLPMLGGNGTPVPETPPSWIGVEGLEALESGAVAATIVSGTRLLVANVGGSLLAYRDSCAGCGTPIHSGELDAGILTCPTCSRRFELPLAGRLVGGDEPLQLAPIPLLAENGAVKVAVGT